jgi:hypothetical protein
MNEVLANSPSGVQAAAAKIAKGEVVTDEDAARSLTRSLPRCSPLRTLKATS